MLRDPIIEEVRQVRRKIEAECKDDPQKFYEHIQQVQERHKNKLVRRKPKPALRKQKLAV